MYCTAASYQESIEILLNVMERQTEDLIVTLAGYKDRMDRFFSYIPGMSSRIGNHIDFPNYEKDELVEIAQVTVTLVTLTCYCPTTVLLV
jgi:hypothetical protein